MRQLHARLRCARTGRLPTHWRPAAARILRERHRLLLMPFCGDTSPPCGIRLTSLHGSRQLPRHSLTTGLDCGRVLSPLQQRPQGTRGRF